MIQEQVFTALSGVVGGRVFPNVAPNNVQKPYVVYMRVASQPENTLADGIPVENTRMQIDCFDTTYAAVTTLAENIKAAVVSLPSFELFRAQDAGYRDAVLGSAPRIGIEAAAAVAEPQLVEPGWQCADINLALLLARQGLYTPLTHRPAVAGEGLEL